MIHILTIHFNDRWVDLQLEKLSKYITQPYRVYTVLGENYDIHKDKFFISIDAKLKHYESLELLQHKLHELHVDDEDIILILDSDAFPIKNLDYYIEEKLNKYNFCAIVEPELNYNPLPIQPFECFYLFKYKFFKSGFSFYYNPGIHSNWNDWMIDWFDKKNIEWYKLCRTNKHNIHPLYYGIYDDIIFHSWCGSFESIIKGRVTRVDRILSNKTGIPLEKIIEENENIFFDVFYKLNNNFDEFMQFLNGNN